MAQHTQGPSLLATALVRAEGWRDRGSVAQRLYPRNPSAEVAVGPKPSAPRPPSIAAAIYPHLPQASKPQGGPSHDR
jgi:hypothetical protein